MSHRELPIIFTAESVRAILSGAKTQTRRVINPQPHPKTTLLYWNDTDQAWIPWDWEPGTGRRRTGDPIRSRFLPGDVLWVKEAWGLHCYLDDTYWYHGNIDGWSRDDVLASWSPAYRADWGPNQEGCFWRSPLYMPRWASRIALEVTEVRAQRVQEISHTDALAEGPMRTTGAGGPTLYCWEPSHYYMDPRDAFRVAWGRINGRRSPWSRNDFVFAYTFRRVEK